MKILLAHDASKHAQAATEYLSGIPFRKPIHVDIVSAVTPPILWDTGGLGPPADLNAFIDEERNATIKRVEELASSIQHANLGTSTHVPVGPASTEILEIAEQNAADLIVLGALGHSALHRMMLGSVSDYVATHADVSTLIVRPPQESSVQPQLSKILVALSGAAEDNRIIMWLRDLKLRPNVEIHLVRILELNTFYRQDIREKASEYWTCSVKQAQSQILEMETTLQQMGLNTETHLVESDHVGEALVDYAGEHGCDLIMTGDSDSGLLTRLILGSTSRYVLRHAQCSVLIVRDQSADHESRPHATHEPG